tara:strand:+ start:4784 stop:6496 length:1713 start_codon:yes stop_codon:yes gene_type:complete
MEVWMSPQEIDLIVSNLNPSHIMLEWGSGGSTVKFPKYVKKYYSIEHDIGWFDDVKKEIPSNVDYNLVELDNPLTQPTQKIQIQTYLNFVDKLNLDKLDRVLIDGRGRGWCAEKILPYLKKDSIVFIHDYWQRPQYHIVEKWYNIISHVKSGQSIVALQPKKEILDKINKKKLNMKISIIQPGRNNLKYLKWSYDSIRKNQGAHEVEICVADDASTDGTWDWCLEMMKKDSMFKAHRNIGPNRLGHTILYDTLINEVATQDIAMIYHADMYLCPGALDAIEKNIKLKTIVSLTRIEPPLHPDGPEKILWNGGVEPEEFLEEELLLNKIDLFSEFDKTTEGIFAPWAFYRKDFQEIGGHDPLYAPQSKEDSDIFNRFQLNGINFIQTWEGFVYHMTCRGSRRNTNDKAVNIYQDSPEWLAQNEISTRNFIRKWGHFVSHDRFMKPIIPPKYDIGIEVLHCDSELLELLEPWCSTILIDDEMQVITSKYLDKEQKNTIYELSPRIKTTPFDKLENEIVIKIDKNTFNNNDFLLIRQFPEIIEDNGEKGEFKIGNLMVTIKEINEYQDKLIHL